MEHRISPARCHSLGDAVPRLAGPRAGLRLLAPSRQLRSPDDQRVLRGAVLGQTPLAREHRRELHVYRPRLPAGGPPASRVPRRAVHRIRSGLGQPDPVAPQVV